jgi:TRAP-type C4-dicarboxylate transport system permease small subunit
MKREQDRLLILLEWGTILSAGGLIITVLIQVMSRRLIAASAPPWTEEVSRYFFIYSISFGAGLAQREGYLVSMDYFYRKFNAGIRRIIDTVVLSVSALLFLVMSVYSIHFFVLGLDETSPGLGLPMSVAFASMPVMSMTVLYYLMRQLIHKFKSEQE